MKELKVGDKVRLVSNPKIRGRVTSVDNISYFTFVKINHPDYNDVEIESSKLEKILSRAEFNRSMIWIALIWNLPVVGFCIPIVNQVFKGFSFGLSIMVILLIASLISLNNWWFEEQIEDLQKQLDQK